MTIMCIQNKREEQLKQLDLLIKEAGNEARMRRKKTLDNHFKKLKRVIADAKTAA
ncbi:hypothetical protein QUF80_05475 [Desulfococcaceae bacterium HSG8]|nr:hypothetical protein [Desulfococcaceae bacterium HSG8]